MNHQLLVTGGVLRENGFELGEGKYYGCAKLLRLDLDSGDIEEVLSVSEGSENFPAEHPNLEFTVGDRDGDFLWLAMDTEIRKYHAHSLALLETFSHPCFHNIHSVAVHFDELYVTSTGLDMVVVLDKLTGAIKNRINAEGKPVWHRFSEDIDYRMMHSTRPHDCHPNFVFWLDGNPWVTRCTQEDAVMLKDPNERIDISGPEKTISVHDGVEMDGKIHFTTVDGCIVVVDSKRNQPAETIDLTEFKGFGGLRGWCRGLFFMDDLCYVGFSRLRRTRRLEKLAWVSKLLPRGDAIEQASILAIDIKQKRIVRDYRFPIGSIDAIYGLM